jgi:hypothetical protein
LPAKEGVGLDDDDRVAPRREPANKGERAEAVQNSEMELRGSAAGDQELPLEETCNAQPEAPHRNTSAEARLFMIIGSGTLR